MCMHESTTTVGVRICWRGTLDSQPRDEEAGYQGICSPSSQLMNWPLVAAFRRNASCRTRFAPTEVSTAPPLSYASVYFAVISVRLKPGWKMPTSTYTARDGVDVSRRLVSDIRTPSATSWVLT